MKKALFIFLTIPLILSSCFFDKNNGTKVEENNISSGITVNGTGTDSTPSVVAKTVVATGDIISVDYVGTLEDGTVFDSSLEEFAKKTKNYTPDSGRKYEPLSFTVGAGNMIKGFDAGVVGMKLGEKKTLVLLPADAYGEAFTENNFPKKQFESIKTETGSLKYFQDVFSETVPLENFKDVITQNVPISALGDKGKGLVVGQIIEASATKAKVTKIEGDNVTVDIENTQNPFYGKPLAVGLKSTFEGNTITVKKISDTEVTIEVLNKANPFYGKTLKKGLTATVKWKTASDGTQTKDFKITISQIDKENVTIEIPNIENNPFYGKPLVVGTEGMMNNAKVTITAIDDDNVTLKIPNTHELAGKTLKFDVEIKSIK